jgi:hypothetical protein
LHVGYAHEGAPDRDRRADSRAARSAAAARGISISELLADIACNEEVLPADLADMRA